MSRRLGIKPIGKGIDTYVDSDQLSPNLGDIFLFLSFFEKSYRGFFGYPAFL